MDKKTFIKELERSLSVLQEDELRDIVGEYEQHIDMKVQSGLTEEEAIADFGSLGQLSAEILEAYHVRADYAAAEHEKGKRFSFAEGEKAGKEILEQTGELCAKTGMQTVRGLKQAGTWLWGVLLFWKVQIVRPFAWAKRKLEAYMDERADGKLHHSETGTGRIEQKRVRYRAGVISGQRKENGFVKSAISGLLGLAAGILRFCWKAAGWCIHMAWNVFWAGFSVFCGVMGLFCLFGLGMLAVLLTQGYPLAGVVIGCLGLNLCLFSAAGLGMTLIWKKQGNTRKTEPFMEERKTMSDTAGQTEEWDILPAAERTVDPAEEWTADQTMDRRLEVGRLEGKEHA